MPGVRFLTNWYRTGRGQGDPQEARRSTPRAPHRVRCGPRGRLFEGARGGQPSESDATAGSGRRPARTCSAPPRSSRGGPTTYDRLLCRHVWAAAGDPVAEWSRTQRPCAAAGHAKYIGPEGRHPAACRCGAPCRLTPPMPGNVATCSPWITVTAGSAPTCV